MTEVKFPSESEIRKIIECDTYIEKIAYPNETYAIVYAFCGNTLRTQYDLFAGHGSELCYEDFKTEQVFPVDRAKTVYLTKDEMENKND
jgi:hypothetical protein